MKVQRAKNKIFKPQVPIKVFNHYLNFIFNPHLTLIIKMPILLTYFYKQLFTILIVLLINLIPINFIILISLALSYSLF
jgi:hypothetical protein